MHLYIANMSKQDIIFQYRLVEENGVKQQRIPMLQQQRIAGDLTPVQLEGILEQHRKYNIVKWDEVDRARGLVTLCYSVDKPVNLNKIKALVEHNQAELVERGVRLRKEAAIMADHVISHPDPDHSVGPGVSVEMVERPAKRGDATEIEETIRVVKPGVTTPAPKRGKRAA